MMGAAYDMENNIWAGFAKERDAWLPEDITPLESGAVAYWAGCTASYVEQDIARGAARILKEGGIDFVYLGKRRNLLRRPLPHERQVGRLRGGGAPQHRGAQGAGCQDALSPPAPAAG